MKESICKDSFIYFSFPILRQVCHNIATHCRLNHADKSSRINLCTDIDGYQILSEVKEKYPRVPVILISERNSGMDRVIGLEMGCDDYLSKPFLPKELAIRAK